MKKVFSLMLAVLLVVIFGAFALASGEDDSADQGSGSVDKGSSVDKTTEIGDYSVVIDSCRLATDYEGDKIVIVKYVFTNNKDEEGAAFNLAFMDEVYQDGVGLNKSYFVADSAKYDDESQSKKIKKGSSIDVEVAYELNDETTDIEVEVSEFISFNDTKITKTFSIK